MTYMQEYMYSYTPYNRSIRINVPSNLVSLPVNELHNPSFTEHCVTANVVTTCEVRLLVLLDYRITNRDSSAGGVAANDVQCASAVHNMEDTLTHAK